MPVSKIQTNGLYIIRNGKQSYLELPNSNRVFHNGSKLIVYSALLRLFNSEEEKILDEWEEKRNKEAEYLDSISDGSTEYWRKKNFFESKGYDYLANYCTNGPLQIFSSEQIADRRLRGCKLLEYNVWNN